MSVLRDISIRQSFKYFNAFKLYVYTVDNIANFVCYGKTLLEKGTEKFSMLSLDILVFP